jgi:hypothetical protein
VADYRDAPDDTRLTPRDCGHRLRFIGSAVDCQRGPDHDGQHAISITAQAARSPLGWGDEIGVPLVIEWDDDRPAATVGDMRALIREAGEQRG